MVPVLKEQNTAVRPRMAFSTICAIHVPENECNRPDNRSRVHCRHDAVRVQLHVPARRWRRRGRVHHRRRHAADVDGRALHIRDACLVHRVSRTSGESVPGQLESIRPVAHRAACGYCRCGMVRAFLPEFRQRIRVLFPRGAVRCMGAAVRERMLSCDAVRAFGRNTVPYGASGQRFRWMPRRRRHRVHRPCHDNLLADGRAFCAWRRPPLGYSPLSSESAS